ncbi:peptidoglycan monomer (N-acetylglucosamine-1,6-anhydro-N-acetylmuramic acid-tetrapeptide) uptake protein (major facilitator superfamily protein) [Escherichia coli]|uniref:Peptidoglycan monomer (N-acetylglucosamine-1,6-anhydro-N-acetylmuramic acid-tetrapeptide) uptake protein (Major facilitator superfamily protein) n=1 Tax=Escherichia coli TaxID=562 RepID=A0A376RMN5_ECOLX|nr:peptidoglycan monomer (N-acetylglucosamine-1,6-anhydro-N-acetylmuramic acid-tetrapeptide) uptake protein (major facilitator superfamily protein) [Escherichia coli]
MSAPVAGWFVEAHGWSTFYLFSVAAAVPGLILLLVCRQTLEYTRVNDNFISPYRISGRLCLCHVDTGGGRQPVGRVVTAVDDGRAGFDALLFLPALLEVGVLVALSGVVLGGCWIIWRYEKRI